MTGYLPALGPLRLFSIVTSPSDTHINILCRFYILHTSSYFDYVPATFNAQNTVHFISEDVISSNSKTNILLLSPPSCTVVHFLYMVYCMIVYAEPTYNVYVYVYLYCFESPSLVFVSLCSLHYLYARK
jgi:hypothetical protein